MQPGAQPGKGLAFSPSSKGPGTKLSAGPSLEVCAGLQMSADLQRGMWWVMLARAPANSPLLPGIHSPKPFPVSRGPGWEVAG